MQKSTKDWKNIGTRMPIRNDNIDLLLLVAGEYATNDEEHFESYLFINGTTLYTNDSYFDTNGWIDPGTCYINEFQSPFKNVNVIMVVKIREQASTSNRSLFRFLGSCKTSYMIKIKFQQDGAS